jgi:hypothetical protein
MRKFLLIEGYLIGENELYEESTKRKKQSYRGEVQIKSEWVVNNEGRQTST